MLSDLRRLRALQAVASRRSFSAAAEDLGYTQSAVSQQIVALEREVGLTLVERGMRPVELTNAGRRLLDHTGPVFEHIATAEAELDALRGLRAGRLRIAGFPSAFATFLPRAVSAFARAHPQVEVGLRECEPPEALRLLRAGQVDLAVVYEWAAAPQAVDRSLRVRALGVDLACAVLHRDHRLARRRSVKVEQLAGEPWIVPSADGPAAAYRATLARLWSAAGFEPDIAFETDDPGTAQGLVAAGLGVVLVNELILEAPHPGVAARRLAGSPAARHIAAVTMAGRRWPPADAFGHLLAAERGSKR